MMLSQNKGFDFGSKTVENSSGGIQWDIVSTRSSSSQVFDFSPNAEIKLKEYFEMVSE